MSSKCSVLSMNCGINIALPAASCTSLADELLITVTLGLTLEEIAALCQLRFGKGSKSTVHRWTDPAAMEQHNAYRGVGVNDSVVRGYLLGNCYLGILRDLGFVGDFQVTACFAPTLVRDILHWSRMIGVSLSIGVVVGDQDVSK